MRLFSIILAAISLSACSSLNPFGGGSEEIVFDTTLGPRTDLQIRELETGLEGDRDNANYLGIEKKGEKLETKDGGGA